MADITTTARELVGDLERRFPYAAAQLSGASGVQIGDNGREQSASEAAPSQGVVFTLYDGAEFHEYATGELDAERLARDVRDWANGLSVRADGPPLPEGSAVGSPDGAPQVFRVAQAIDPSGVSLSEKLARVRDVQSRAQSLDARIVQAQVNYAERAVESAYLGRGRALEQQITRMRLTLLVFVSDGAQSRYHFFSRAGVGGFELATLRDDEIHATVETAIRLLEAGKIEPGEYTVVTDSSLSGVLAHESFGHGVEMDLYPKGRALSAHYLGQQVAAPAVQMFDDPSFAGAYGSYFFDDEGELARPTQILRDGVFVQPLSDLASATYTPGPRTPNGRRQDFSRKVYARMSNTFFGRGQTSPAEMIAGVERGVYLRHAQSGMEDPMGWGIQVTAEYGEEIVNGQLTGRLFAPVGVTGYVPDVLSSIDAIGDDFALEAGTCGKGHKELVPVTTGGPHLRMRARLG